MFGLALINAELYYCILFWSTGAIQSYVWCFPIVKIRIILMFTRVLPQTKNINNGKDILYYF